MTKHFLATAAAVLTAVMPATAQAPDPVKIIEGARIAATLTELEGPLDGSLSRSGKRTPIALFLKGQDIQFQYAENRNDWNVFHMRLGDEQFELFRMINGRQVKFPREQLIEPIANTDLTYEDLAFRFFYWPNPKFEGEENVNGQACYKIRLDKPVGTPGRYEAVYVWVHKRFGAFMRIRGHNREGGLIKEFQVEDVMQVTRDVWTLRRMQVSSHNPANGRRTSITTVTFDPPRLAKPRAPR
ncbi:MAG: outer membrane lipoprotein-sorting protein [Luteolibacter sp.]